MEHSLAVANYFIRKSIDTGIELTPMKLVKLTYISHGWYLAFNKNPLLNEATEAWKYGPVVPLVYNEFKKFGKDQITSHAIDIVGKVIELQDKNLTSFLDEVWRVYKGFDGLQLSTLTHQANTPWDIIWNKNGGKSSSSHFIIPNELIQKHYEEKLASSSATS